ncbi:MAG: DUF933 domain-containing protein, partial [Candidatus Wallbacteria bacterium]|nr:DUF933 domain-containing protein [Candidatus Wallbacteria bacterium]
CERLKKQLEEGVDIRKTEFTEQEQGFIYYYNLISLKKRLLILNKNDATPAGLENQTLEMLRKGETNILVFDGKLELEMSELPSEDRESFKKDMGIEYFSSELIQRESLKLLDYITFFTVGEDECRSWPVKMGSNARTSAGKIHSDLEKGFIRAEVVHCDDLIRLGAMAEVKKQNLLRLEGGEYIVKDGDIMHVRFNL